MNSHSIKMLSLVVKRLEIISIKIWKFKCIRSISWNFFSIEEISLGNVILRPIGAVTVTFGENGISNEVPKVTISLATLPYSEAFSESAWASLELFYFQLPLRILKWVHRSFIDCNSFACLLLVLLLNDNTQKAFNALVSSIPSTLKSPCFPKIQLDS